MKRAVCAAGIFAAVVGLGFARESFADVAADLAPVWEAIPSLAHRLPGTVLLIPRGTGGGAFSTKKVKIDALGEVIGAAVTRAPHRWTLSDATPPKVVDDSARGEMIGIATAAKANYLLMYSGEAISSEEVRVAIAVFDLEKGRVFREERTVRAPEWIAANATPYAFVFVVIAVGGAGGFLAMRKKRETAPPVIAEPVRATELALSPDEVPKVARTASPQAETMRAPEFVEAVTPEWNDTIAVSDTVALPEGYEGLGESFRRLVESIPPLTDLNPIAKTLAWGSNIAGAAGAKVRDPQGLERYRAIGELGRGAMGVVYKARDLVLERDVALKIVGEEVKRHPEAILMFLQEAKALAALNHPNIVTVHDQGQYGDDTYLVMEFVEGRTADALLRHYKKLTLGQALEVASQVSAGLAFAHGRRILHRDIKPANVFVSTDGTVKIGDFGLARVIGEAGLRETKVCGTPLYMAPEQIQGTDLDLRADLYSFGCMMFELLVGRPPFTTGEVLYHHMHTAPPVPSSVEPSIPPELDALILRCLEKDKARRFSSGEELRDTLRALAKQYG